MVKIHRYVFETYDDSWMRVRVRLIRRIKLIFFLLLLLLLLLLPLLLPLLLLPPVPLRSD